MANFGLKMIARAPGLRRIPLLRLLAITDVVRLARDHANKLTPDERKRMLELVQKATPLGAKLTDADRDELKKLVLKAEPRIFAGETANFFSPIPIPRRIRQGPKSK